MKRKKPYGKLLFIVALIVFVIMFIMYIHQNHQNLITLKKRIEESNTRIHTLESKLWELEVADKATETLMIRHERRLNELESQIAPSKVPLSSNIEPIQEEEKYELATRFEEVYQSQNTTIWTSMAVFGGFLVKSILYKFPIL